MSDFPSVDITLPTWPGAGPNAPTGITPPIAPQTGIGADATQSFINGFGSTLGNVLGLGGQSASSAVQGLLGNAANLAGLSTPGDILAGVEQFFIKSFGYAAVNILVLVAILAGVYLLVRPEANAAVTKVIESSKQQISGAIKAAAE